MKSYPSLSALLADASQFEFKKIFADANFCGTTTYHKVAKDLLLTDGAMHTVEMMPEAVVGSVLSTLKTSIDKFKKTEGFFQLLVLQGNDPRVIEVVVSDGNYNLLDKIVMSCEDMSISNAELDMPNSFEYYAVEEDDFYVLMLKSEY